MKTVKVSVIGASGYSGIELIKILKRHPGVSIDRLFANTSAGKRLDEVVPAFGKTIDAELEIFSPEKIKTSDLICIALPSGEALKIVPQILAEGKRVIDLGGDFRLKDTALYERYYKRPHTAPEALQSAVFGLPEWFAGEIRTAAFVSNPGCYPTGAILPLAPLVKEGLVDPNSVAVSSLSGVSGAGRSASADMSFTEINESVRAYKVGSHQHIPEIRTIVERISGRRTPLTFVPHLIPITRGIYTSIFTTLTGSASDQDIYHVYEKYYRHAPFVRWSTAAIPEIKNVVQTNYIDIGFKIFPENKQLVIFSVIDNLVKGAAGQAVQNMNIMFGFNETEGLF
ncbi:MAG: N-acetyl-gamma-glutamyl-phosphate reductase [Bacteroidota bacterium]